MTNQTQTWNALTPSKANRMRIARTIQFIAVILLLCASAGQAQVSPLGGIGNVQFLDNNGSPLTAGVLYVFQAGTTTQAASYTDSTGATLNPNPVPFGSGGRASIWVSTGGFFKYVLCLQNDGAFCAPGDVLFSADNVPGGASGGGGGGSPFTGVFISSTASPSSTGILRLASSDSICWRNAAGSTNLCVSKDSNDLLSWTGGSLKLPEVSTPSCSAGFDVIWADNTAHRPKTCGNGGAPAQLVVAGGDINTSDQVTQLHFGATGEPLGTAPTTGQFLQWNGSNIIGNTPEIALTGLRVIGNPGICGATGINCVVYFFTVAHTLTRLIVNTDTAPSGCSPNAQWGVRDLTAASNLATITPTVTGVVDSGPLSVAMIAGHQFGIGVVVQSAGCGATAAAVATATYQ